MTPEHRSQEVVPTAIESLVPHPTPQIPDHEILRCIGQGSYGEVWLARSALGTFRAVKIVNRERLKNEDEYKREFAGIRRFEPISRTHDGFVDILQVGHNDAGDWFYYVMELADDAASHNETRTFEPQTPPLGNWPVSIADWRTYHPLTLASRIHAEGRLPVADCVRLGLAITSALDHLHRHGLVHRDIKPSNIIFVNSQPKLADVGLVAETSEARSQVGTPGFVPLEGPGSVQADLYALGKVLYAASTGHGATEWPNPLTGLAELPDQKDWLELNEVINRACDSDTTKRYTSAAEMQADLALIQSGKSLQRMRRRDRMLKQAGLALAVTAVVVLSVFLVQQMRLRAAQRATLLLELEKAIQPPHAQGWSERAWQTASNAAVKFGFDTNLQSQAAASLAGLDAKVFFQTTNGIGGSSVAFDREGKRVLFGALSTNATDAGKAHLLDLTTSNLTAFPVPGEGPVAFLPDGTPVQFSADATNQLAFWLASGDGSAEVRREPRLLRQFDLDHGEQIATNLVLAMTPGGAYVAASGLTTASNAFCAVWDGATGRLLLELLNPGVAASLQSAAIRSELDQRRSAETPLRSQGDLPPASAPATALALTPDGSLLAASNDEGVVTVWRVADGAQLAKIEAGRNPIRCLAFCRDFVSDPLHPAKEVRWLLAMSDSAGGVGIWEVSTNRLRTRCLGAEYDRFALAFSPDGTLLVSAGRRPWIAWDTATGYPVLLFGYDADRGDLKFSRDGRGIAWTSQRGSEPPQFGMWAIENGRGVRTLRGLAAPVTHTVLSSDGRWLAAASHAWQVGIWDLPSNQLVHVLNMPRGFVTADNVGLAFSPDGSQFAYMANTNATLIEVTSGNRIWNRQLPPGYVEALAFNPSGHLMAFHREPANAGATSFLPPTTVRVRDLSAADPTNILIELPEFNRTIHGVAWSPDASYIVIEGVEVTGRLTNRWIEAVAPATRTVLWSRLSQMDPTSSACLSIDAAGQFVAIAPGPGRAPTELCDPASGDTLGYRKFSQPPDAFNSATGLACIRAEGHIRLHRLADEALLLTIQPNDNVPAFRPTFTRDGRLLAWGNQDGTVSVCHVVEMQERLNKLKLGW